MHVKLLAFPENLVYCNLFSKLFLRILQLLFLISPNPNLKQLGLFLAYACKFWLGVNKQSHKIKFLAFFRAFFLWQCYFSSKLLVEIICKGFRNNLQSIQGIFVKSYRSSLDRGAFNDCYWAENVHALCR